MYSKGQSLRNEKESAAQRARKSAVKTLDRVVEQQPHSATIIQRALLDPGSLTAGDVLQLQRTIGNQGVGRLLDQIPQHYPIPNIIVQRGLCDSKPIKPRVTEVSMNQCKAVTGNEIIFTRNLTSCVAFIAINNTTRALYHNWGGYVKDDDPKIRELLALNPNKIIIAWGIGESEDGKMIVKNQSEVQKLIENRNVIEFDTGDGQVVVLADGTPTHALPL